MTTSLPITIRQNGSKKVLIQFDSEKFEKLAASFGLFGKDFLKSISKAEKELNHKKVSQISSLKQLRK